MKESTMKAFEAMRKEFGNKAFTIGKIFGISEQTFYRWYKEVGIEKVTVKSEWTLEEVVEELNACAGQDCYVCDWQFIIEDGKIYNTWEAFQFV